MLRAKSLLLILGLMTVVFFVVALIFVPSVAQAIPSSCYNGCPSGQCCTSFLAGTEITVDKNGKTVKIEQLKVGDSILSFIEENGDTMVNKISFIREGIRDYYFVIEAGEFQVKASANHPFYVGGNYSSWDPAVPRGYKRTDELEIGERIYLLGDNNRSLKEATISEIVRINQPTKVYSLTVDNDNNYFAERFAVHNKFCADCYKTCKSGNVCGYVYGSGSNECSSDADCTPTGCTPGATESCSIGVCPGTKTCLSNRTWGSCQKDDSGCPYICTSCSGNSCVTSGQSASPCEGCSGDADCIPPGCTDPVPCSQLCTNWQTANCNEPCGFYGGIQNRDCDPQPDPECPGCNETRCVDCACGVGVPACAAFQPTCAVVVEPTTSQALSLTNPSFELGNSTGWNPFSNGEVHSKYAHPGSGNYGAGSGGEGGPYEQTINAPQTSLYRVQSWGGASCYRWQECGWGCASTWAHINIDGYEGFTISEGTKTNWTNGIIIWNELNRIFPPKDGSLRVSLYSREDVDDPACGYAGMWSAHDDLRITKINSAQTTESDLVSIRIAAQGQGGITQFKVKNSATGQWGSWNTWSPGADGTVLSGTYLAPEVNTVEVNVLDYYGQVASCTNTVTFEQKDPWFQTQGGDVHGQTDIYDPISADASTGPYCSLIGDGGYPGVISYGTSANFGAGSASERGWLANSSYQGTTYGYEYFDGLIDEFEEEKPVLSEGKPAVPGIYKISGDQSITINWSIGSNQSYVFLIDNGKLTINGNIDVAVGGFIAFIVDGDIEIGETVTSLQGIYIVNGEIETSGQNDTQLLGEGMFVGWEKIPLRREFIDESLNNTLPVETFTFRPDLWINAPKELLKSSYTWQELAP